VEATLADALSSEAALSKSTVSRVCAAIKTEFERWRERRFDDFELDYLFLNASHFRMHTGAWAEPVLAARGIRTDGNRSSSRWPPAAHPRLRGLRPGPESPRAALPAAGHQRRGRRPDQRGGAGLPARTAATLPEPGSRLLVTLSPRTNKGSHPDCPHLRRR
jgi:hypothetical protein